MEEIDGYKNMSKEVKEELKNIKKIIVILKNQRESLNKVK